MKEDKNIILLSRILLSVILIIFIFISIVLVNHYFIINKDGYNDSKGNSDDNLYKLVNISDRQKYNNKLNNTAFLGAINVVLKEKINYLNVELLQNVELRFKFLYSYALNDGNDVITKDLLNNYSRKLFNRKLDSDYDTFLDNINNYEISKSNNYCIKVYELKDEDNLLTLKLGIVPIEKEVCANNETNYSDEDFIKEAILIIEEKDNNYYINKFTLIEKESD